MVLRRPFWLACLLAVSLVSGASVARASDDHGDDVGDHRRHPVPYNITQGVVVGAVQPGVSPPGSNDFSCEPSSAHPNPVVLVHGAIVNKTINWQTMSPFLANHGYCVFALTYGMREGTPYPVGGLDRLTPAAYAIRDFVARVREATGARRVDLVGHSEGALAPQYYLRFLGGADEVDKFVSIAGVPKGFGPFAEPILDTLRAVGGYDAADQVGGLACPVCFDAFQGSDFIRRLNDQPGGPAVPGVRYTTLVTRYDELVVPYTVGQLHGPDVTNIVTQDGCPEDLSDHGSIVSSRRTGQVVLNALDPRHTEPLPCDPVAPLQGSDNIPFLPLGPGH